MSHQITFQQLVEGVFGITKDVVPFPAGFLKTFQRFWIQNCAFVPENQLDQIEFKATAAAGREGAEDVNAKNDAVGAPSSSTTQPTRIQAAFTVNRSKLVSLITAFEQTLPPLCPILSDIAETHHRGAARAGGVGGGSSKPPSAEALAEESKTKLALRDLGLPFEELAKLPLAVVKDLLFKCGLSLPTATRIAGSIYKRHREASENEVQILTPRSAAVKANERFDRSVSFQRCRICPDDLGRYLPSIARNTELARLDLSFNNIHAKGAKALADTLRGLPNLVSLSLAGNNLQYEGIRLVCQSLQRKSALDLLDLSNNNGGSQTGAAIGGGLAVRKLCVAGNHITSSGIIALIPAARSAHSLVVASNNFGTFDGNPSGMSDVDTAGKLLVSLINTCEHLSYLDISNNSLSTDTCTMIIENSLMNHPALTGLGLSMNAFSEESLLTMCFGSPQIVDIDLASTSKPLAEAVSANKTKMMEFRAFLTELGVANWSNQHVNDALTYLMKRRDVAVQMPINGALLMTIKSLSSLSGGHRRSNSADGEGSLYVSSAVLTNHITCALREDFDELCDFLDGFRPNNGDVVIKEEDQSL